MAACQLEGEEQHHDLSHHLRVSHYTDLPCSAWGTNQGNPGQWTVRGEVDPRENVTCIMADSI